MGISQEIQSHKLLIIFILGFILVWFLSGKIQGILADHDDKTLQAQKLLTDAQVKANAQIAAQVQSDADQLQVLTAKVQVQDAKLIAANAALASALSKQQKTDATLPLPDLAVRWGQLVPNVNPTANSSGTISITSTGALNTVNQLEKIPILTQELSNETAKNDSDATLLTNESRNIVDLNFQMSGLNKLIADNSTQCEIQIKVVKAQSAKSKRKWFIFGYVSGFISGLYAHAL
jgi:hypothetical protein